MTDLRQAAQQALEALTAHADLHGTMYLKMDAITALRAALAEPEQEPVAWMHEGPLGRYFNENRNDVHSIPLYCAPMTHDSDFIQIPVAYQYAYPDGFWRCSYGDAMNGSRPITSRALYARKDGK